MGRRPTPELVEWQEAARTRLRLVADRKYQGMQRPLADALGVSHTLVSLVLRAVQPPTRNLMARLGAVAGVNPHWAATGEGEPFLPDTRGTLPVSGVLLPGPPADHPPLLTGERFAAPSAFDRVSCYYWRLPADHPATAVDAWRLLPGDLVLLETARAAIEVAGGLHRRRCVLDGGCVGRAEPMYGEVGPDQKSRLGFRDGREQVRFIDLKEAPFAAPATTTPKEPTTRRKKVLRRRVKTQEKMDRREADVATDPWFRLPGFRLSQVIAVQLLMVRPSPA